MQQTSQTLHRSPSNLPESIGSRSGCHLLLTPDTGAAFAAALSPGTWLLGSSPGADIIVPGEAIASHHLELRVEARRLSVRNLARHVAGPDDGPACEPLLLGQGEHADLRLPGHLLRLSCAPETATDASAGPASAATTPRLRLPGSQRMLLTIASAAVLSVSAAAMVSKASADAPAGARAPMTATRLALDDVRVALVGAGLEESLQLRPAGEGGSLPVLAGALESAAECARFTQLRASLHVDAFTDRVACIPQILDDLRGFLQSSGLEATYADHRIQISGTAVGNEAQARLAAVRAAAADLVEVDARSVHEEAALPPNAPSPEQLRARVASAQGGDGGHVVTRNGEIVYPGGELSPGVRLESIEADAMTVSMGASHVRIAL